MDTVHHDYACPSAATEGCAGTPGPECPGCTHIKQTVRSLPPCGKYVDGDYDEVWQGADEDGRVRFFRSYQFVPNLFGGLSPTLSQPLPPHSRILGCDDGGSVRFFIERQHARIQTNHEDPSPTDDPVAARQAPGTSDDQGHG